MDRMIYVAMAGAREVMHRQATNNHNLANVNTTAFKAQVDALESKPVYGPGNPSRVHVLDVDAGVDLSSGTLVTTGNPLDVALEGEGFLLVQDADGEEAMTRDGSLRVSASGMLETRAGDPVLGDGGPITVSPYESIAIAADGTVSIRPLGEGATVVLDRIRLVKPDPADVRRAESGLFTTADGELPPADASVRLAAGAIESSNVDPVNSLVTMIELARRYETQVKLMKSAEENDARAQKLLQAS